MFRLEFSLPSTLLCLPQIGYQTDEVSSKAGIRGNWKKMRLERKGREAQTNTSRQIMAQENVISGNRAANLRKLVQIHSDTQHFSHLMKSFANPEFLLLKYSALFIVIFLIFKPEICKLWSIHDISNFISHISSFSTKYLQTFRINFIFRGKMLIEPREHRRISSDYKPLPEPDDPWALEQLLHGDQVGLFFWVGFWKNEGVVTFEVKNMGNKVTWIKILRVESFKTQ